MTKNVGAPFAGTKFYYSSTGNDMDNAMLKSVALPAGTATLTAKARYNIEDGLGLRLRHRLDGWRCDVRHRAHEPLDERQPERAELRRGHHGCLTGEYVGRPDGRPVGLRRQDRRARVRVLDRWRAGRRSELVERHRASRSTTSRSRGQPLDGAETDRGWNFDAGDGGFHVTTGVETQVVLQRLRRREPSVHRPGQAPRRLRRPSRRRAVQLRRHRSAPTGPSGIRTRTAC